MEWDVSVRTGGKGPWPQPTDGQLLQEVGGGWWHVGDWGGV